MKKKIILLIFLIISLSMSSISCNSSQEGFSGLQDRYMQLQYENEQLKLELDSCNSSQEGFSGLQDRYMQLQYENEQLKLELDSRPTLRDFDSRLELENWLENNLQPETVYIDDAFIAALKVQNLAKQSGYIVGLAPMFIDSEDYFDAIFCSAIANGILYVFSPETGEIISTDLQN